jgi:hypothetical protein
MKVKKAPSGFLVDRNLQSSKHNRSTKPTIMVLDISKATLKSLVCKITYIRQQT